MIYTYRTTFEDLGKTYDKSIDVTLDVELFEGDPGCMYTSNGDGWPSEPAHAHLVTAHVDAFYGDGYERSREECCDWEPVLDRIAEAIANAEWNRITEDVFEEAGHPDEIE